MILKIRPTDHFQNWLRDAKTCDNRQRQSPLLSFLSISLVAPLDVAFGVDE